MASAKRKSLTPLDITAVLTKVVQDQDRRLSEQKQTIDQLSRRLQQLEEAVRDK